MSMHFWWKELKSTLNLSIPLILAQLIQSATPFLSTFFIAHLGQQRLAASVLVNMTWIALTVFFFGTLNALSILVSRHYGANNKKAISRVMGQGFILAIAISILSLIFLPILEPQIIRWTNQPYQITYFAMNYLESMLWAMPPLAFLIVLEQFLYGIHHTKLVLWISLFEVPLEILMMYLLVFGHWGLPRFGIAGTGYGQATVIMLATISITIYLLYHSKFRPYAIFSSIHWRHYRYLLELLRVGLPIGGLFFIELGAFFAATMMMGQFSDTALAAHQIAFQYLGFTINIIFAMSQAVTVRVGYAVGSQHLEQIKRANNAGMLVSFIIMLAIAVIYIVFPRPLILFDLGHAPQSDQLITISSIFLAIVGVFQLTENFRLIAIGALRGLKDTQIPMLLSFIAFWLIAIPLAYIIGFPLNLQGIGVWLGLLFASICGCIMIAIRLRSMIAKFAQPLYASTQNSNN